MRRAPAAGRLPGVAPPEVVPLGVEEGIVLTPPVYSLIDDAPPIYAPQLKRQKYSAGQAHR